MNDTSRARTDPSGDSVVSDDGSGNLSADCLGGGHAYVGHGINLVLVGFTAEVGWWRNAAAFSPAEARKLAEVLVSQADASDHLTAQEVAS